MPTVDTPTLTIAYEEWTPSVPNDAVQDAGPVVLVHGWPDSPRGWRTVGVNLANEGYRVLAPALRGFGDTTLRAKDAMRSGQLAALGRDLLEFLDALDLRSPVLVGHDWGARAVANACGLRPEVARGLVMISVGYGTNDPKQQISFEQTKNYWYHWYLATERGERAVRGDRAAFTRFVWDSWSPTGWFDDAEFTETAKAFDNPDWADVVLHSYRHRWAFVPGDPAYDDDEAALVPAPQLAVPTLVLHGVQDACNHPDTSANKESFFTGPYRRMLLDGVGHFPQREAPQAVSNELSTFIASLEG